MSYLDIDIDKIVDNIENLSIFLDKYKKKWSLVVKILGGNREILEALISEKKAINPIHSFGDSRLSGLRTIKSIDKNIKTMYIKPPNIRGVESIVKYADISLNSSLKTIKALDDVAKKHKKRHQIVIMLEMGELREGILRENVIDFYEEAFKLDNIEVIGLGTNLGCMYGVEPTYDKLLQLALYRELISAKFNKDLPLISGGTSITLPLIKKRKIPLEVNHFRVGESIFMGTSPLYGKQFNNLREDNFIFNGIVIEKENKQNYPDEPLVEGNIGVLKEVENQEEILEKSTRVVLDFGQIDVEPESLKPKDKNLDFVGSTSDMTVYRLKHKANKKYTIGQNVKFIPNYMGVARLMTSKFILKNVIKNGESSTDV